MKTNRWQRWLTGSARSSHPRTHLHLDLLEERCLLSTFPVFRPQDDSNPGSLRWAITQANANPGPDLIDFQLGSGLQVLTLASALPAVTDTVKIDATPGVDSNPVGQQIEINGGGAGNAWGLELDGNGCELDDLSIVNFIFQGGILVHGSGEMISECYLGTDFNGTAGLGNGEGILFSGSQGSVIQASTISGNLGSGVDMEGDSTDNVLSDYIGVLSDEVTHLPDGGNGVLIQQAVGDALLDDRIFDNTEDGVAVTLSEGITIGVPDRANIIKENGSDGIEILGEVASTGGNVTTMIVANQIYGNQANGIHLIGSSNNQINGKNVIGTDEVPKLGIGNQGDGVRIESPLSTVSTNNSIDDNYIAGNDGNGVTLTGSGTTSNSVVQNLIGLAPPQAEGGNPVPLPVPNQRDGVALSAGANNNTIGGIGLRLNQAGGLGNIISANGGNGVSLQDQGTTQDLVQGNVIGTDQSGTSALGNGGFGVLLLGQAENNQIGGTGATSVATGQGNLISANGLGGLDLQGAGTTMNQVQGNFIGTDFSGTLPLGNSGNGVTVETAAGFNTIGGPLGLGNLVSGNHGNGVEITTGASGNLVESNRIGTNVSGTAILGNTLDGVYVHGGADDNTIGGIVQPTAFALGNIISGNQESGIGISDSGTTGNQAEGNRIGTDLLGLTALANSFDGVLLSNSAALNTVGGNTPGAGNLISGNGEAGVRSQAAGGNIVQGNFIGTDSTLAAALGNANGVEVLSNGDTVVGNLISGNHASGIVLQGSQNQIQANKIGTDFGGTAAVPNQQNGISISVLLGPGGNTVGGTVSGSGNLISGNGLNGIDISGPASAGNAIEGNAIGTVAGGGAALANSQNGIFINNTTGYTIGGGVGNVISGNQLDGVRITGSKSTGLVLVGDLIGTDWSGTVAVANQGAGVRLLGGANHNTVGGVVTTSGPANLISGNMGSGIVLSGTGTNQNTVQGDFIGTTLSGGARLSNAGDGVDILSAASNNPLGGPGGVAPGGMGNLISANSGDGVHITGSGTSGNSLQGNQIGTDLSGTLGLGNVGNGVHIFYVASGNIVGTPRLGNLISGNFHDGVQIAVEAMANRVEGNQIGTDTTGALRLPNGANGVHLLGAANHNVINGNLIAGNAGSGVVLTGAGTAFNQVEANEIGTDASGQSPLSNVLDGVDVLSGANYNQIGGTGGVGAGALGNLISGNRHTGLVLSDAGTSSNTVEGNFIGTTRLGLGRVPNLHDGLDILHGATQNQVGGPGGVGPGGQGNLISGNGSPGSGNGVTITGSGTNLNVLEGNEIGTDLSGQSPLGNLGRGVFIAQGAQDNAIGGTAVPGNVIAFNVRTGISVGASKGDVTTVGNSLLSNCIHDNGGLGIDLGDNGVTPNTPKGPHMGPNDFQNFPMIGVAVANGSTTVIHLALNSIPGTTVILQVFANTAADSSGHGEGQTLVGTTTLMTNGAGNGAVLVTVPQNLAGLYLSATATAPSGDTSEFSKDMIVAGSPAAQRFDSQAVLVAPASRLASVDWAAFLLQRPAGTMAQGRDRAARPEALLARLLGRSPEVRLPDAFQLRAEGAPTLLALEEVFALLGEDSAAVV
jgi:parallel beta-helix repeat protein